MVLISPIYVMVGKKRVPLNLNWYRNAHFQILNKAKVAYKTEMAEQIWAIQGITWPVKLSCKYYLQRRSDVGNVHSVVEKFFLDALVTLGRLPDDDINFVVGANYQFAGFDTKRPRCEITLMENYQE